MTEFKNEFKWSLSRDRHFRQCRRLFYLSHYAHWGGWQLNADEFTKLCYRLTKMKNLDTWAGEIVHLVISQTLQKVRIRQPTNPDGLTARAIQLLRTGWKQSKNQEWRLDPKRRVNLFEHYYNLDISPERTDEIKHRVLQCLENFWRSPTFQFIRRVGPQRWKSVEEFQTFRLGNFSVVIKMDLALEHEDWLYIYDWKTGREHENDLTQLVCYALYSMKTWGYGADRIKVIPAYLRPNVFPEHHLTPSQIIEAQEHIFQSCQEMLSLLTDATENIASRENFPMTTDIWKCKRCFFWQACYGNQSIATSSD